MALTKVLDGGTNFTGATSAIIAISRSVSTSTVTSVDFDNLSTDFDTFYVTYFMKTATDGAGPRFRFLDSSGSAISGTNNYQYYYDADGGATQSNGNTLLHLGSAIGSGNHEGQSGYFFLNNRNYASDATNKYPACIIGGYTNMNTGGNGQAGYQGGQLSPDTGQQLIRGFSMFASDGNGLESHDISLYALERPS